MTYNTINGDKTIAGGGEDTFFAGRLYAEATKGTEATKETDRAFKSLPSLTSLEGGTNG